MGGEGGPGAAAAAAVSAAGPAPADDSLVLRPPEEGNDGLLVRLYLPSARILNNHGSPMHSSEC